MALVEVEDIIKISVDLNKLVLLVTQFPFIYKKKKETEINY